MARKSGPAAAAEAEEPAGKRKEEEDDVDDDNLFEDDEADVDTVDDDDDAGCFEDAADGDERGRFGLAVVVVVGVVGGVVVVGFVSSFSWAELFASFSLIDNT